MKNKLWQKVLTDKTWWHNLIKKNLTPKNSSFILIYIFISALLFLTPIFALYFLEKLFLLILSLLIACFYPLVIQQAQNLIKKILVHKFVFSLLIIYLTFASIGNYLFLHPPNFFSLFNWLIFMLFLFWLYPLILTLLYLLEKINYYFKHQPLTKQKFTSQQQLKFWLNCFCFIFIAGIIYLLAFNPAIMSPDSYEQIAQAIGQKPLHNWHPVFHTLFIRFFINNFSSVMSVIIAQILFFAFIFSFWLLLLYQKNINHRFLLFLSFFFTFIPTNGFNLVTLWKDIPYSISLLWLTYIFIKIIEKNKLLQNNKFIIWELALALLFVASFRHNGIIVYLLSFIALTIIAKKEKIYSILVGLGLSAILILSFNLMVLPQLNAKPADKGNKYFALINDIAGIHFMNVKINQSALNLLETTTDLKLYQESFSYYWAFHPHKKSLNQIQWQEFIKIYLQTFLEHPLLIMHNVLLRNDFYWNIVNGKNGTVNLVNYIGDPPPENIKTIEKLNLIRKPFFLTFYLHQFARGLKYFRFTFIFLWRFGIWLAVLMIINFWAYINQIKGSFFMSLPLLSNIFSLVLSSGWYDYRYGWNIFLITPLLFLYLISYRKQDDLVR